MRRREWEEEEQRRHQAMMAVVPPQDDFKTRLLFDENGFNRNDQGGHQRALNFPQDKKEVQLSFEVDEDGEYVGDSMNEDTDPGTITYKLGDMTIGYVYDGNWKSKSKIAGKGERKMCKMSEKHIEFLHIVKACILPYIPEELWPLVEESMRTNLIFGADTLKHTDSFRGATPNLYFQPEQHQSKEGWLVYDVFPKFKSSLVVIDNKYYVPHGFSEVKNELRCMGENPMKPGYPIYFVFPLVVQ